LHSICAIGVQQRNMDKESGSPFHKPKRLGRMKQSMLLMKESMLLVRFCRSVSLRPLQLRRRIRFLANCSNQEVLSLAVPKTELLGYGEFIEVG
jgi:hypothetical protein